MGTCFIHDGSQDKAVDEVCDLSSIVGGFKCLFGSHNAFPSHVGDERSSHRGQPHIEVDSIRNEETAPDLIFNYKQGKYTQTPIRNEGHAPNPPSRGKQTQPIYPS